ncbi:nucleotidyltransferase domain-containing protein [Micromonospora sp. NPDC047620]|uniref:nucleotidyltransferase domain-containing protein n=1 Tax=Micromonospora sp. NPDC047620 TaxID=3364251 RepID=UPI0037145373
MDGLTGRQLDGIAELAGLASTAGVEVWLRGGWAMDFHLGEVTRPHVDVDWYCWRADAERLAGLLRAHGWRPDPRMPVHLQLDLVRDDVEVRSRTWRGTRPAGWWWAPARGRAPRCPTAC